MHVLVPQKIIREYRAGQRNGEFRAIGLFVDISGFSRMTNDLMQLGQHGAEILANGMREVFAPLVNSVYAHQGFIATFAGDAFTALFPLDQESATAAQHALSAAWEIQTRIQEQKLQITGTQVDISTRVGLACGGVSWGIVDSDDANRAIYYFRGDAVENCAEAESLAEAGQTIIDADTRTLLLANIQCEDVSEYFRVTEVTDLLPPGEITQHEQVDLEVAGLFYPQDLITQTSSGEFRQTVNMFINLPTVRTEEQLSIFIQYIFNLQDQYGGLLNRIDFGDKGSHLLLFWGAPMAYENDIGRALNFILSLQTETSIPIKAGITYQIAHAGFIGAPLREEYTCYGRGVNLAARFMTAAPRGEVWIDDAIAKRVAHYFDVEYIDELALKGFEEKQKVYALYERKESQEPYYKGPFIGREQDKAILTEYIAPLWQPSYPGAMIITGDAGIGKSRLVYEFLHESEIFQQHDATIALCHTDQMLRDSFNPFRYWLRRYFGISETQVEARNKRAFNQVLDQLIHEVPDPELSGELDRTRSFLAALVNLFWQDSLYEQLDPESRYENTIIGLISLIKAESLRQPVVMHLEDIQWIDEDSRRVLSQLNRALLADQTKIYPVALICTSRIHDEEQPLGPDISQQSMKLKPLVDQEITRLTEAYLQAPVEENLAKYFSSLSEGNPFYAEQILHYLEEEELLEEKQGQWKLKAAEELPTPTDVRSLLVARIDQFPGEVKDLVQKAAVLGREFDKSVLLRMAGDDQITNDRIRYLEKAAVWTQINPGKYLFRSNLLKESAYQMQIYTRRQKLHADAANALEGIYEEDLKPHYYQLAHHAELGKLREKAGLYLREAGNLAFENYQNQAAIDYLGRALQHTEAKDLTTQVSILLERERVNNILGRREEQKRDIERARVLAEKIDNLHYLSEVAVRQIMLSGSTSEPKKILGDIPAAIALAEKAQRPELIVSINIWWADVLRLSGDYENARQILFQARDLTQKNEDLRGECSTLNTLSLVEMGLANFQQARSYLEECLSISQDQGNLLAQAQTLNNLGVFASEQGDYSSALYYYRNALTLAQKIGARMGEGILTLNLGWLAGIMGDFPASREFLAKSHRIMNEIGDGHGKAAVLLNLSLFAGVEGDYSLAKTYAEEGLAFSRELQYRSDEAVGLTVLGHALTGLGMLPQAKKAFEDALEIRQGMEQTNLCCEPMAGLALIGLLQSDLPAAEKSAAQILDHLAQGGTLEGIDHPNFVKLVCYKVLKALGDSRAQPFLEEIRTTLEQQAAKIQDDELRQSFIENVPWHQEILQEYQQKIDRA